MKRFGMAMAVTSAVCAALGVARPGIAYAQYHAGIVLRGGINPARPIEAPRGIHDVFGTIVSVVPTKTAFVMRARNGRLFNVDAASAIANGRFSGPLFLGKVVLVSGGLDARHVFRAVSVTRMTRLDAQTPADR